MYKCFLGLVKCKDKANERSYKLVINCGQDLKEKKKILQDPRQSYKIVQDPTQNHMEPLSILDKML